MRKKEPIIHGTTSGYLKHRRRDQDACGACKAAQRDYYIHYRRENGSSQNKQ